MRGIALDLEDILGAQRGEVKERPNTPNDVLCITLREVAERYVAGCPFKPGDLVTPRQGYGTKGVGRPHVVLEVAEQPHRLFDPAHHAHPTQGMRLDMRVAGENCHIHAYWVESWEYEPYTGPVADLNS